MNIQDKFERILREMHILLSRAPESELSEDYVLIPKKEMQRQLNSLSQTLREMMDQYEMTEQSRNRGELEAEKRRMEIVRNANQQAEDIYAASVIYTEDALGKIQGIMEEAEKASKEVLKRLSKEMEEEKRRVRSNQLELITQLEDMKDSAKYMKLIEERNRENARAKARKQENERSKKYQRKTEKDTELAETATEKMPEEAAVDLEETVVFEKPVIKINQKYFEKIDQMSDVEELPSGNDIDNLEEDKREEERIEKRKGFFSFGRKPQIPD